ncbi:MAG: hypothetical protein KKB00_09710 [Gammaproteobacteria bacterium]|nr:hypothetical protein [Gammaproteobacteria bacterium]
MALSRRDWNNVIIYSVLAMLLLFYFVPQHLMNLKQQQLPSYKLVPDGYKLVQMQFDRTNLQQAGPVWRFQPVIDENLDPAQLAEFWQQTELKPWPQQVELSTQPIRRVALLLAGDNQMSQWGLYQNGRDFYLKKQGFVEIFQVSARQAEQLIPASLSHSSN